MRFRSFSDSSISPPMDVLADLLLGHGPYFAPLGLRGAAMIALVLGLAVVGFLLWLIDQKIPMDPTIKIAIRVIVLVIVILYLWRLFNLPDLPIPRFR